MTDKEKNRFNYKDKLIYEAIENNIKAENGELTKLPLYNKIKGSKRRMKMRANETSECNKCGKITHSYGEAERHYIEKHMVK